jgi:hypothetical protein
VRPESGPGSETEDVVALWRLQSAYADVVNRRAWPELRDLFRPDAAVQIDTVAAPVRSLVGPDAVGEFIAGAIEKYDHFSFVILNAVVDVIGPDEARARTFMCEIRHEAAHDEWSTAYGLYQDSYIRIDGRWWFSARSYRSLARTGPQAGVFGVPDGLEPFGP